MKWNSLSPDDKKVSFLSWGTVAQLIEYPHCGQEVVGSNPNWDIAKTSKMVLVALSLGAPDCGSRVEFEPQFGRITFVEIMQILDTVI